LFWEKACRTKSLWLRPDRILVTFIKDVQLFLLFLRDMARA